MSLCWDSGSSWLWGWGQGKSGLGKFFPGKVGAERAPHGDVAHMSLSHTPPPIPETSSQLHTGNSLTPSAGWYRGRERTKPGIRLRLWVLLVQQLGGCLEQMDATSPFCWTSGLLGTAASGPSPSGAPLPPSPTARVFTASPVSLVKCLSHQIATLCQPCRPPHAEPQVTPGP